MERLPVNKPGSDIQSRNEQAEESTETDSTKKGEGSKPGNWHLYCNSINHYDAYLQIVVDNLRKKNIWAPCVIVK